MSEKESSSLTREEEIDEIVKRTLSVKSALKANNEAHRVSLPPPGNKAMAFEHTLKEKRRNRKYR